MSLSEINKCPACGHEHEPSSATTILGPVQLCPHLPSGYVYEDREYASGPRGALHDLEARDGSV